MLNVLQKVLSAYTFGYAIWENVYNKRFDATLSRITLEQITKKMSKSSNIYNPGLYQNSGLEGKKEVQDSRLAEKQIPNPII